MDSNLLLLRQLSLLSRTSVDYHLYVYFFCNVALFYLFYIIVPGESKNISKLHLLRVENALE